MSSTGRDDGSDAYGVEEIEVTLSITDGKITTKSMSGPKSGSLELFVDGSSATLVLNGAGSDRATAALTGPELANFRTMVDAALSKLMVGEEPQALGRNVLYSGYRPLDDLEGGIGVTLDEESLRRLDLVTEEGRIAGGGRQVQCTILGNGTAILNLKGDRTSDVPM
jgi:hypothetical protein